MAFHLSAQIATSLAFLILFAGAGNRSRFLCRCCMLGASLSFAAGNTVYRKRPQLLWTKSLPGTGDAKLPGISRRNTVQISPDDTRIYVTLDDGTLHLVDPETGNVTSTLDVEEWAENWKVDCASGVSFHSGPNSQFSVYSVMDEPPQGIGEQVQSRVISVAHPSGEVKWISSPIPGRIAGTPVITSDGLFVLMTRNTDDDTVGHFTILSVVDKGKVKFTESSNKFKSEDEAPYSPVGITHRPTRGLYNGGLGNDNDFVIWADSTDFGRADDGLTRGFQFPVGFNGIDFNSLTTEKLRVIGWTSTTKPVFAKDGQSVFFTATRAAVRAWVEQDFGGPTTWKGDLERKKNDGLQPLYSSIGITSDEKSLFVGSATSSFVGIDSSNGVVLWSVITGSIVLTKPLVSPNDEQVYFIESYAGTVRALATDDDGRSLWSMNCATYLDEDDCFTAPVEADFSQSTGGNNIYFGNKFGTLVALSVAYVKTPAPSPFPTPAPKTQPPTSDPASEQKTTISPRPTQKPTTFPTAHPSKLPTAEPSRNPIPEPTESPKKSTVTPSASSTVFGQANNTSGSMPWCRIYPLSLFSAGLMFAIFVH